MHLLLTGANGYIGLRLLPALLDAGHRVTAVVRDRRRFPAGDFAAAGERLRVIEGDFLKPESLPAFPADLDAAYYLLHSMGSGGDFAASEEATAGNFTAALRGTKCRRIIYLGGLVDESRALSPHLKSRLHVEEVLRESGIPLTVLRASIIVGSGSASFEIVRDLAEKLPVMVYAEMKLPGEAWLEFRIEGDTLRQTATFRPQGLSGRAYWYAVLPFHGLLFPRMARRLAAGSTERRPSPA